MKVLEEEAVIGLRGPITAVANLQCLDSIVIFLGRCLPDYSIEHCIEYPAMQSLQHIFNIQVQYKSCLRQVANFQITLSHPPTELGVEVGCKAAGKESRKASKQDNAALPGQLEIP